MPDSDRPSTHFARAHRTAGPGRHRGPHPEDGRLFSRGAVGLMRVAAEELAWLQGRGYSDNLAIDVVGRHHQLESRQRLALLRAVCSQGEAEHRAARRVPLGELGGKTVLLDGLNVVITLEVALSGGVLLRGSDDTLRDLAGLRGSYHLVEETDRAIALVGETLRIAGVGAVRVLLDAPVSNSGRLRARFEALQPIFGCEVLVQLVPDPDPLLSAAGYVVTADSAVLRRAKSWINLGRAVVAQHVHEAWVVDLG